MGIKLLFKYEEPINLGGEKVSAIRQVPRGVRFVTERGPLLVEAEYKEIWTEEELHELFVNRN
jgi:hypothetical protein